MRAYPGSLSVLYSTQCTRSFAPVISTDHQANRKETAVKWPVCQLSLQNLSEKMNSYSKQAHPILSFPSSPLPLFPYSPYPFPLSPFHLSSLPFPLSPIPYPISPIPFHLSLFPFTIVPLFTLPPFSLSHFLLSPVPFIPFPLSLHPLSPSPHVHFTLFSLFPLRPSSLPSLHLSPFLHSLLFCTNKM